MKHRERRRIGDCRASVIRTAVYGPRRAMRTSCTSARSAAANTIGEVAARAIEGRPRPVQGSVCTNVKRAVDGDGLVGHECDRASWSTALQGIVASTNEGIQLREIRARRAAGGSNGWSLRIVGRLNGTASLTEADTFRIDLQRALEKAFGAKVTARLVQAAQSGNSSNSAAAEFTIETAIAAGEKPSGVRESGS